MNGMTVSEAQLFRLLSGFFGSDRVIWSMSVKTVCSGKIPSVRDGDSEDFRKWVSRGRCLFTIVNDDDEPKLVIEFAPDFSSVIELSDLAQQRFLPRVLKAAGIQYLTVQADEFEDMIRPDGNLDIPGWLRDKVLDEQSAESGEF